MYVGAVNARMLGVSGALADGVQLGAITSPGYVRWAREQVAAGARAAGRDPATLDLAANVLIKRGPRRGGSQGRHPRGPGLLPAPGGGRGGRHLRGRPRPGRGGPSGRPRRWGGGRARAVTGHLIDVFAAAGDPDQVTARLADYTAAGLRVCWPGTCSVLSRKGLELLAREVAPRL